MPWPTNREVVFLRVDETAPIDMVLMQGDIAVNIVGISKLGLILTPQDGSERLVYTSDDASPAVSVLDASLGKVRFNPIPQDLVTGMIRLVGRWYIILAGKLFYFPQDRTFELNLIKDPHDRITFQRQIKSDAYLQYV